MGKAEQMKSDEEKFKKDRKSCSKREAVEC